MQTIPTPAPNVQRKLFMRNYTAVRRKQLTIVQVPDHLLISAWTR
jgi:hypothetical protein